MTTPTMSATDHIVLKSLIVGLLRSHAVQSISFTAASVRIDHEFYSDLVNLVLAGKLHLGVDPTLRSKGFRGMYYPDNDGEKKNLWKLRRQVWDDAGCQLRCP